MSNKRKGGRPSKYEAEWKDKLPVIQGWARDGLVDEQIASNMGISTSTLYDWKKKYLEFSEALKKGKEVVDREVENALLKRALGYQYTEVKTEYLDDGVKVTKTVKEVIPDTTAQIFWLKNRKPEQWRDKQEIKHEGSMSINNPLEGLTTEELKKLIDK